MSSFALHGNVKRGIVHNRRRMVVSNVGTVDGDCWRCDVAFEGRKRRGYYGHGTKERFDAVLVVTVAVTGGSGTENWKTEIGCLSNLSDRSCSSVTIFFC